jgi:hypothetical protein
LTDPTGLVTQPRKGVKQILTSYFYWTYPRGSFHYDIMVTLILLFIFVTPHLWNYGEKAMSSADIRHPIQVTGDGEHGFIVTVFAADVSLKMDADESKQAVKKALRRAIEPVTGDAVFVDDWKTYTDAQGNLVWKVWAHR